VPSGNTSAIMQRMEFVPMSMAAMRFVFMVPLR